MNENGENEAKIFIPNDPTVDSNGLNIGDGATVANLTTAAYLNYHREILSAGKSISVSF